MEFKELKCKNCGAKLKVPEDATRVTCEFCQTEFAVESDEKKAYDTEKGRLRAQEEHMNNVMETFRKKNGKFVFIPIIMFVLVASLIGFFAYRSTASFNVDSFNMTYDSYSGTQSAFFLQGVVDDIITNNKTNKKHIITLVYDGVEMTEEDDLSGVSRKLAKEGALVEYYVSFDYDGKGYINKITMTK